MKSLRKITPRFRVSGGRRVRLRDYSTNWTGGPRKEGEAQAMLAEGKLELSRMQERLYAQNTYSLLIIVQAMNAAGKDGTIGIALVEIYNLK